jgi:hypothetical protein
MQNTTSRPDHSFRDPLQMESEVQSSADQLLRPQLTTGIGTQVQLRPRAQSTSQSVANESRLQIILGAAAASVFASIAPALALTLYWHIPSVAPMVFTFTLMIALSHTVLLGLPLFLIFQPLRWVNIVSCVVLGAVLGGAPASILTYRMVHSVFMLATGEPIVARAVTSAAILVSCIKPVLYFGLFGALGGLVFWVVLRCSGCLDPDRQRRKTTHAE